MTRAAPLALLGAVLATGAAEAQGIPPDTVTTVYVTDTILGYGAVGGVAVDALGFVYVADFRNGVWRISPDGELTEHADGLYGASGNAIGPRGYLYQSSFHGDYVSRISRTGEVETWVEEGLSGPVGIAASPDGELFVVNCRDDSIARVGPDRSVTELARSPLMACPNGITLDDRGDLYVVNFNNTKVLRVTTSGEVSEFADVPGAGGNGHIAFAGDAFYMTTFRGNRIVRLLRDGTASVMAGTGAAGTDDGPALQATFTRPNGIAVAPDGKTLWVNDYTDGQGLGQGVSVVSMRRIRLVTLSDVMNGVDLATGTDGVRSAHSAYHRARPGENSSADAISLAYEWLSSGRTADALALFEANADSYPDDAASQFHLGEAFRYTDRLEQAAAQYRRVLAIDPEHSAAATRLEAVTRG